MQLTYSYQEDSLKDDEQEGSKEDESDDGNVEELQIEVITDMTNDEATATNSFRTLYCYANFVGNQ